MSFEAAKKSQNVQREKLAMMSEELHHYKLERLQLFKEIATMSAKTQQLEKKIVGLNQTLEFYTTQKTQEDVYNSQRDTLEEFRDALIEGRQRISYSINFGTMTKDSEQVAISPMVYSKNPWKLMPGFQAFIKQE